MDITFNQFFTNDELQIIRAEGRKSRDLRQLTPELLNLIQEKGWFRVTIPLYSGGREWELCRVIALYEALAYADGSLGWVVNLGSGGNLFAGFLPPELAQSLFQDSTAVIAGSGAISGEAKESDGGYIITGEWRYASGAAHATYFTFNAQLIDQEGESLLDDSGTPLYRSFIVPRSAVQIKDTWDVLGLEATSSCNFLLEEYYLEACYAFDLTTGSPYTPSPLYHYPFTLFSLASMSVMCSGMALHFLEKFNERILPKRPLYWDQSLGENLKLLQLRDNLKLNLQKARDEFTQHLERTWQESVTEKQIKERTINRFNEAAYQLVEHSYQLVTQLYRYCGMDGLFNSSPINHLFRDFIVAQQHFLVSPLNQL